MPANRAPFRRRRASVTAAAASAILFIAGSDVGAAEVMFARPLHITREISLPFTGQKRMVDEYCFGNRIVSISGNRTAIVDHAKQVITMIDFDGGTYSVTSFAAIASARERKASPIHGGESLRADSGTVTAIGPRVVASRPADEVRAERREGPVSRVIHVSRDRQILIGREAAEALLGAGYPNAREESADVVLRAIRAGEAGTSATEEYFLPLRYDVVIGVEGETVETRNVVVNIGSELPPTDRLAPPPGAKLVESDALAAPRLLEELDRPVRPTP
jgi:hypothetical protein